jgi:integrase
MDAQGRSDPTPTEPAETGVQDARPGLKPSSVKTLGQPVGVALSNAADAGLEVEFGFVAQLTGDPADPGLIGPVLHWLASRPVAEQLAVWAEAEPFLRPVSRLADFLAARPGLLRGLPAPEPAIPVSTALRGKLDFYLAALVAARRPPLTGDALVWCDRFRGWLFAQAVRQALTGNPYDRNLQHLAAATRNAFDDRRYSETLTWLGGLATEALSLAAVSYDLERNAQTSDDAPAKLKTLASRLRAVARGAASPLPLLQRSAGFDWVRALKIDEGHAVPRAPSLPSDVVAGAGRVVRVPVHEGSTPGQSTTTSRSVLLANAEDLNFLPYSWRQVHTEEVGALSSVIQGLLASTDGLDRLLASIASIAWVTGHSMETVGSIAISADLSDHWSLDPASLELRRRPSRRPVRWQATDASRDWIVPLADQWRVALSKAATAAIRSALKSRPTAGCIAHLWPPNEPRTPEVAFNAAMRSNEAASRLSSGRLESVLRLQAYAHVRDAVLARLLTARFNSGLPGAFSYPAWPASTVTDVLKAALPPALVAQVNAGRSAHNAAGSELDPIDQLLATTFNGLRERYLGAAKQADRWIDRHNLLTSYCVIALLAATGGRPVESPFESPTHFNWKRCWLFVNDKSVEGSRAGRMLGRLIPLPRAALGLIEKTYLPHLAELQPAVAQVHPALAREIGHLCQKQSSGRLPFFFFLLNSRDGLDWMPVRESTLGPMSAIEWPLPWNLLRHRLATRLRRLGLDPEIIDALLGHGEYAVESYGEHSWRVPLDDFATAQGPIEAAYAALRLEDLPVGPVVPTPGATMPTTAELDCRPFGAGLRYARREQDRLRARQEAHRELTEALQGRDLSSLSADEVEALGQRMVLTAKGLPHPFGSLRYEVFEAAVAKCWQQGRQVRRKRRDVPVQEGRQSHPPEAVDATDRLAAALRAYRAITWSAEGMKAPSAALVATVEVCLVSRVSSRQLLSALWRRQDHKLVKLDGRWWLEHQLRLHEQPQQPVTRIPVSPLAARLLAISLSGRRGGRSAEALPDALVPVALGAGLDSTASAEEFLKALGKLAEAANSVELPRVLAAWLDGRVTSWGLLRQDWIRFRTQAARLDPGENDPAQPPLEEDTVRSNASDRVAPMPRRRSGNATFDSRTNAARRAIATCNRILLQLDRRAREAAPATTEFVDLPERAVPAADGKKDKVDTSARRAARRRLARLARAAPPDTPTAVIALIDWARELLVPSDSKLAASSIRRYVDALSPRFRDFLHDVDLAELDADDLTDLYSEMAEARYDLGDEETGSGPAADAPNGGSDEGPAPATTRERAQARSPDPAINRSYVAARLREFHVFARDRFGIEEPDWSEVADAGPCASGSPGAIREQEYLRALHGATGPVSTASRAKLCHGMLLLLAFRFGLRGKEAHGLQRRDWADHFETTVVLVRSNALRALKTPAAQRQVPQLGTFTTYENALVRRMLATWDALCNGDRSKPLLSMDAKGSTLLLRNMRRTLIAALKSATCNALTNLHHARHSFANELALALAAPRGFLQNWRSDRWINPGNACRLLLGTTEPTRRSLWALARTLGHASPLTTVRSYVHLFPDLLAAWLDVPGAAESDEVLRGDLVEDLDRWPAIDRYLSEPSTVDIVEAQPRPSAVQVVTAMKLVSRGHGVEAVAHTLGVSVDAVRSIESLLELAQKQLARGPRRPSRWSPGPAASARPAQPTATADRLGRRGDPDLPAHIEPKRWDALAGCFTNTDPSVPQGFDAAAAMRLIRPAAQLVLWRREHFAWARAFIDAVGLQSAIQVFETDDLHERIAAWADEAGFTRRRRQRTDDGLRIFQIDGVRDGEPESPVRHRCALVPSSDSPLSSRYELLALWIAYCAASERAS